jgi:subtilase family serine protease
MLRLTVALEPRDPNGLRALATDASTPGTPAYRHYLSLAQFSRRFGATASQTGAVQAALRARGLVVGPVTANGLTLPVTGTAAQVEQAFSTSILEVRTPGGSIDYANAQAPALPRSVAADVQAVTGLDDLALERPQNVEVAGHVLRAPASAPHVVTGGPQPCSAASAAAQHPGGYTADAVASAYQFAGLYGGGDQGAGQTVALVELEPYSPADIATYQSCYATGVPVSNVDVDGGPGAYTPGVSNDDEAALDIEQLIGLAPKASVVVYQAPDTGAAALAVMSQIVSDDSAKVVATSWGVCEAVAGTSQMSSENTLLQEAAAQGRASSPRRATAARRPVTSPITPRSACRSQTPPVSRLRSASAPPACTPTVPTGRPCTRQDRRRWRACGMTGPTARVRPAPRPEASPRGGGCRRISPVRPRRWES